MFAACRGFRVPILLLPRPAFHVQNPFSRNSAGSFTLAGQSMSSISFLRRAGVASFDAPLLMRRDLLTRGRTSRRMKSCRFALSNQAGPNRVEDELNVRLAISVRSHRPYYTTIIGVFAPGGKSFFLNRCPGA